VICMVADVGPGFRAVVESLRRRVRGVCTVRVRWGGVMAVLVFGKGVKNRVRDYGVVVI